MIIAVLGAIAAGKTTFSTALGESMGLRVLRIDDHHRPDTPTLYSCDAAWDDLIKEMRDTPQPFIVESSAAPDSYCEELKRNGYLALHIKAGRELRFKRLLDRGIKPEVASGYLNYDPPELDLIAVMPEVAPDDYINVIANDLNLRMKRESNADQ